MNVLLVVALLFAAVATSHRQTGTVTAEAAAAAAASNPLMLAAALSKDRVAAGIVVAAERGDYTAEHSQLALVIKPRRGTVCDRALKRPLSLGTLSAPAHEAFWRLTRDINPSRVPAVPPGVVCGGSCDTNQTPTYTTSVTLSLAGGTLEDGLSQVVHGAPGLVWVLREEWAEPSREWTCTLEYFSNGQRVQTFYVLASAPAKQ